MLDCLFPIESNRTVSVVPPCAALPALSMRLSMDMCYWVQVQKQDIPDDVLLDFIKDFGNVKLFRT